MLRGLVALLLLANVAWFAWAQGHLRSWGLGPAQASEAHRLRQQLRPEALRVLPEDPAAAAAAAPAPITTAPASAEAAANPPENNRP